MNAHRLAIVIAWLPLLSSVAPAQEPAAAAHAEFDQSHAAFTAILGKYVKAGRVDYAGLKRNSGPLTHYLHALGEVPQATFKCWSREEQMAFLINLYNATTLKLVIDHDPLKSIKDIGGLFSSPWKQEVVLLFGKRETLDHIEHDMLRPNYQDPRVHFAVNCASIGCPALRSDAYQPDRLDRQLDEQARDFLRDPSKNRVDTSAGKLYLSPIFDWFAKDFVAKSGSVEKFVAPYFLEKERAVILRGGLALKYTDYSWKLNRQ